MNYIETLSNQQVIELAGVVTGLLCVLLAAMNKIWNWPVAIVSVIIYMFIFYDAKLYADMGLQGYFLVMNIYGWYYWSHPQKEMQTPVRNISLKEIIISVLAILLFTALLGFTLYHQTDASFPFVDSFCTACSIVAQVFLARKVLENWLIWIVVDIIYVWVYIEKNLDMTALMYAVYIVIAAAGYISWRRTKKGYAAN